jgi:NIMA (never in mitosis gene a)-related kinase
MSIFVQLCRAIRHVHKLNVMHRDLKAQNVFLATAPPEAQKRAAAAAVAAAAAAGAGVAGGEVLMVKLGDFGISKQMSGTASLAETQIGASSS